jgi:hypothetical protein
LGNASGEAGENVGFDQQAWKKGGLCQGMRHSSGKRKSTSGRVGLKAAYSTARFIHHSNGFHFSRSLVKLLDISRERKFNF